MIYFCAILQIYGIHAFDLLSFTCNCKNIKLWTHNINHIKIQTYTVAWDFMWRFYAIMSLYWGHVFDEGFGHDLFTVTRSDNDKNVDISCFDDDKLETDFSITHLGLPCMYNTYLIIFDTLI